MSRKYPTTPVNCPTLVLCGVEERLALVLAEGGAVLAAEELAVGGRAMRHMVPALDSLLSRLGLKVRDLTSVAVARGPGSFTGLRITMATALGLARAANLPLAGLDYLPLLAAGPAPLLTGSLAVITHSRSAQVYVQTFAMPHCTPLAAPAPLSVEQAAQAVNDLPGPRFALGTGLRNNLEFFEQALTETTFLDARYNSPLPYVLALAAAQATYGLEPPQPLYLRASDAEDNLAAFATARGQDPVQAQQRLDDATSRLDTPHCQDD